VSEVYYPLRLRINTSALVHEARGYKFAPACGKGFEIPPMQDQAAKNMFIKHACGTSVMKNSKQQMRNNRIERISCSRCVSIAQRTRVNPFKMSSEDSAMAAPHRSRAILSKEKACQIFCSRGLVYCDQNGRFVQSSSKSLALAFGVSPKTIRDIWNGRTWSHITGPVTRAIIEVYARQT
jgi:hypothetical protein